jgi:twitching motility two-component system response regulator PilH
MTERILVVDDEADVTAYLSEVLEDRGYQVHTADSAETALRLATQLEPDLICVDIIMPRESGIKLYMNLRRRPEFARIPILIISGIEQQQEFDFRSYVKDESIPAPEGFIEKPIAVDSFLSEVERSLRKRSGTGNTPIKGGKQ